MSSVTVFLCLLFSALVLADQTSKPVDIKLKPDAAALGDQYQHLRRHFLPSAQNFVPDGRQTQPWSYSHLTCYVCPCACEWDRCCGFFSNPPLPHPGGQYEHHHGRHFLAPHQVALK